MAIEDYGFLLSNPKSPPSLSLYQKKTENQEKSDSRGRKSDFFSGFIHLETNRHYFSGKQRAIISLGTRVQFLGQLLQHLLKHAQHFRLVGWDHDDQSHV